MAPLQTTRDAPSETIVHFKSIPWTSSLLSDPRYEITTSDSRLPKTPSTEDSFTALTLSTPETIPYLLPLRLRTLPAPPPPPPSQSSSPPHPTPETPTYIWLLTASPDGLAGYPNILHGGAVATLLDECLSCLVVVQSRALYSASTYTEVQRFTGRGPLLTKTLEVNYKRPAMLPGTFAVRAWITGMQVEERKKARMWLSGELVDGEGKVCAEGKGVWVEMGGRPNL